MIQQLAKEIEQYILFLKKNCDLEISLHPGEGESVISETCLMKYIIHCNPYCLYLKSNSDLWKRCVMEQEKVFRHCKAGPFYGMCFAGTEEFVYPVLHEGTVYSFISVSGYRTGCNGKARAAAVSSRYTLDLATTAKMYENGLREKKPDPAFVDCVTAPLVRMLEYGYQIAAGISAADPANSFYRRLLHYINLHHTEKLTLESLANQFNYSVSYISHIFKKKNGKSIPEYINILRINEAKGMLENSQASVEAIAMALGYSDSNYFSVVFKKFTGCSPLSYRKNKVHSYDSGNPA